MTKAMAKLAVFEGREIRKTIHNDEWWFSVIDIIQVLTGTERPRKYWNDLKKKLLQEGYFELSEKIGQFSGAVAGRTRKDIEAQSGQPVVSSTNYKTLTTV